MNCCLLVSAAFFLLFACLSCLSSEMRAIGIDIGSSSCSVGVWNQDHVEVIPDESGNTSIPFCLSFSPKPKITEIISENSLFDVKRLLGRKFEDLKQDLKYFPFLITNSSEAASVQVAEGQEFSPEELLAMVLVKLKQMSAEYLSMSQENAIKAVISVPATFNDAQRRAVKNAGAVAGLEVLRITTDTSSTGIVYSMKYRNRARDIVLIDFGASKLDVAAMNIEEGVIEVKALSGSTRLGGIDIDNKLVDHCVEEIKKKHSVDIRSNPKAMRKLRAACEKAKIQLSTVSTAVIQAESLAEGIDLNLKITRAEFEEINNALFQEVMHHLKRALTDSAMPIGRIHDVVLVGGSSRIPKLQQMLREFFDGKELHLSFNTGESVVHGAAVHAAILTGEPIDTLQIDVNPFSIGISNATGGMVKIIPRNSYIPCKKTQYLSTSEDNSSTITLKLYEGDNTKVQDNNLLGTFVLGGILPAPRGVPYIEVSYQFDANGILLLDAVDKSSRYTKIIITSQDRIGLSAAQVQAKQKRIQQLMVEQD